MKRQDCYKKGKAEDCIARQHEEWKLPDIGATRRTIRACNSCIHNKKGECYLL